MHLYTYSFTSKALTGVTKNVLAVSLMISSVNLTDLTESDLGAIVQVCYQESNEDTMNSILEKLKEARKKQIEEKKGETYSSGGSNKAAFRGDWDGVEGVKRLLGSDGAAKGLFDAWKQAMDEEEAIPSYQPPEVSKELDSLFSKLD